MNQTSLDRGKIEYEHRFEAHQYPYCDNCEKPISLFGKYIRRDGKILYVHISYDYETKRCIENAK